MSEQISVKTNLNRFPQICSRRLWTHLILNVESKYKQKYHNSKELKTLSQQAAFWKHSEKRKIAKNKQFLLLPQYFPLWVMGYPFNYRDFLYFKPPADSMFSTLLTKYVQSRLLHNCCCRERVKDPNRNRFQMPWWASSAFGIFLYKRREHWLFHQEADIKRD